MSTTRLNIPAIIGLLFFISSCSPSSKNTKHHIRTSAEQAEGAAPSWIFQSNVYEVNVRQYTAHGTFNAFLPSLPRLKKMGVDILWFMPITPISKTDRKGTLGSYYAVQDYRRVNPEFGNLYDWKSLVKEAHRQGFKIITDWVANHTGADHPWLQRHPSFYNLDSTGKARFAFDWSDTRDLNYDNRELRDSMIAAMKYWVTETDIDGFRCDVAGEVPDDFWKECIIELRKIKPLFMLAEGDKSELHKDGFDATYAWDLFQTMKRIAANETNAKALDSALARQRAAFPANAIRLCFTSNHDENSWNKSDYGTFPGETHAPFAVLTQTFANALPLIYSGQEEPVLRKIEFFEKDKMEFGSYNRAAFYDTLLKLRKRTEALATDASFTKLVTQKNDAVYAFVREKRGQKILVLLNFSGAPVNFSLTDLPLTGEVENVFAGTKERLKKEQLFSLESWGYLIFKN